MKPQQLPSRFNLRSTDPVGRPVRTTVRLIYLSLLFSSAISTGAIAQWKQIGSFGGTVASIYFMKGECGSPRVGFVGTQGYTIQKTTDGGNSWRQVLSVNSSLFYVSSFAFKDTLLGWCTIGHFDGNSTTNTIWKTTDGGDTWVTLGGNGCHPFIYYHKPSARLLVSSWVGSDLVSTDDGLTWQPLSITPIPTKSQHNGFAFATPSNGLVTAVTPSSNIVTNDGGVTWSEAAQPVVMKIPEEAFAPFAIPCTTSYLYAAEGTGNLRRSDDGGITWKFIHNFSINPALTGDLVGDATHLFVQLTNGIQQSTDVGVTWTPIGGPGNTYDTKMEVRGGFLFAGDLAGHLFRYPYGGSNGQLAQLQLSKDTLDFATAACASLPQVLRLTAVTACSDCVDSLHLKSAVLSGSPYFVLVHQPDPANGITGNDSIVVKHNTAITLRDTATLLLTFREYGQEFTRTIVLIGASIPHASARVGLTTISNTQQAQLHAGDTLKVFLYAKDSIAQNAGLSSITCSVPFGSDAFTVVGIIPGGGWNVAKQAINPASIDLTMSSTPHAIRASEILAEIDLLVELTTARQSGVRLTSVHFNDSDPNYENCYLTSVPPNDSIAFTQLDVCGDSVLRSVMLNQSLFQILSISPDPVKKSGAHTFATLHLNSRIAQSVTVSISDITGREVIPSAAYQLGVGLSDLRLELTGLAEGAYLVRVLTNRSVATTKLLLQAEGK